MGWRWGKSAMDEIWYCLICKLLPEGVVNWPGLPLPAPPPARIGYRWAFNVAERSNLRPRITSLSHEKTLANDIFEKLGFCVRYVKNVYLFSFSFSFSFSFFFLGLLRCWPWFGIGNRGVIFYFLFFLWYFCVLLIIAIFFWGGTWLRNGK